MFSITYQPLASQLSHLSRISVSKTGDFAIILKSAGEPLRGMNNLHGLNGHSLSQKGDLSRSAELTW
jgi:hypothetical protein